MCIQIKIDITFGSGRTRVTQTQPNGKFRDDFQSSPNPNRDDHAQPSQIAALFEGPKQ